MDNIINKLPKELYENALSFKEKGDYTNYIMYMTHSANLGHNEAISELFDDYINTFLHKKQDLQITKPFYELTDQYSYSLNYLGYIYERNNDIDKSYEYFQKAFALGNPVAACNLSTHPKIENKEYYLEISSKSGFGYASLLLGVNASDNNDYDKAANYYELAISQNFKRAYSYLGNLYYKKKEYEKAVNMYEVGHLTNYDIGSTIGLAYCCYDGKGIKQDYNRARELIELAYNKDPGNREIYELLGIIYYLGNGAAQDWNRAFTYFKKGAEFKVPTCMIYMAELLMEPGGAYNNFTADFEKAKELYDEVIQMDTSSSIKALAFIHLSSVYIHYKNYDKMIKCLEEAISLGSEEAMFKLGKMYFYGEEKYGIKKDYDKALELFERIKDDKPYSLLAKMYQKGLGVQINLGVAMDLYEKSASLDREFWYTEVSELTKIYKQLGDKIDKDHVINFLLDRGYEEKLKEIYGYLDEEIKTHKLKYENNKLIKMIQSIDNTKLNDIDNLDNDTLVAILISLPTGLEQYEKMKNNNKNKCVIC